MKINSCEVFTWYILSIRILGGGVEIKNLFKHNLANTASAIEKWPFGNSAPNRIFYIISKRLFFALAKTAIITHNTVAYSGGPLWQACKNQGNLHTCRKIIMKVEKGANSKTEKQKLQVKKRLWQRSWQQSAHTHSKSEDTGCVI